MAFLKFLRIFKLRRGHHRVAHGDLENTSDNSKDYTSTAALVEVEDGVLRQYSWLVVQKLTDNFSQVVGSGGFSTVYLGYLSPHASCSTLGAFKIVHQKMKQEIDIQHHLRHPNIVKLLGYCPDQEMGVLVFEYMENGTLYEKLHGSGRKHQSTSLSWKKRMAIAYQLASAIEYLHERCTPHIVHGDIKSSNILLDNNFNSKLCDFGSAKLGFSSSISPRYPSKKQTMVVSPGYLDPHYFKTGLSSKKNDIYSFGVILLELITGMEAFCAESNQSLISVAGQVPAARVSEIMDSRLGQEFNLEEAKVMASISALCLQSFPSRRPSAGDILQTMNDKFSSVSLVS